MQTAEIRRRFLTHFENRGHTVVASAPLVYNDPTLLFVNAGMVPFKPYFIGAEDPPFPRATSVQKCVRTLDIEEVGKTTRHGTFFQMNGNFSFGDYFKQGAIQYAWELITNSPSDGGYGFDPDTIWVTVYLDDDEAARHWREMGIPEHRIQRRGLKDNYWHMGIAGPGGPCSEIYVDRGSQFGPDGGPIVDEDRFLEIWNLVFMQYELENVRAKDDFDIRQDLPKKNIDTGMGLERVAYLLQGKDNMYEIDEVYPVIAAAAELSGKTYGANHEDDVRMRVVADHTRSALMLMTDGVTPGNEARGYVLRRLLRRAIRSMRLLGVEDRVLPELLPVSRDLMSQSYPEVATEWQRVSQNAFAEEDAFRRTLSAGTQIFDLAVASAKNESHTELSGERAFQLHDTYGFPIDLTLEMANEQGLSVDRDEFTRLMTEQRARAKADAKAKKGGQVATEAYRTLRAEGETRFVGYTDLSSESRVRGIIADGQLVTSARPGQTVELVVDQTPFYAESGGQDSDAGLFVADGVTLDVVDVQKPVQGLHVHKVQVTDGELVTGSVLNAQVSGPDRLGACQAHSATHVVHAVLREILGPTAVQAGSYNKPGYLRFDFNSTVAMDDSLREELEGRVNEAIKADLEVSASQLPLAQAKEMGAMAMFGEKYPDIVRMVEMGGPWSRELCGGTHVERSSQIGLLSLLGESSVGSGVRRVEALVSTDAFSHLAAERALVNNLATMLKVQPGQLADRVGSLVSDLKTAQNTIADLKRKELANQAPDLIRQAQDVGPVKLVTAHLDGVSAPALRDLAQDIRDRMGATAAVVALFGGTADKVAIVVASTTQAQAVGAAAGKLTSIAVAEVGGRGGGRDDLAQGGGSNAAGIPAATRAVEQALAAL